MHPYRPRPIRFLGPREHAGWRIKVYEISHDAGAPVEWPHFERGLALALGTLPAPAVTAERPGAGFLIAHQGRGADYAVVGWWDRENELPVRVFFRDRAAGDAWRPAQGGESFCVWDLQVIWFERETYVATVLGGRGTEALDEYLRRGLDVAPPPAERPEPAVERA